MGKGGGRYMMGGCLKRVIEGKRLFGEGFRYYIRRNGCGGNERG